MASLREIRAAGDFLFEHARFAPASGSFMRFVVLAIVDAGIGLRRDDDLRDVILRLGDVKLRAILVVEVGDVLIGDGNLGDDFAVQQFLNRELTANDRSSDRLR